MGKVKSPCPECNGEGVKLRDKEKCKKCKGQKVVKEKKRIEFMIDPGTEDGERIALRGEGDEAVRILLPTCMIAKFPNLPSPISHQAM